MKLLKSLFGTKTEEFDIPYKDWIVTSKSGKIAYIKARVGAEACRKFYEYYPAEQIIKVDLYNEKN